MFNPLSMVGQAVGYVAGGAGDIQGAAGGGLMGNRGENEFRAVDPNGQLAGAAQQGQAFGMQGQAGFGQAQRGMQNAIAFNNQLARGQHSVSAEQLRQGLQQNLAAQQAAAAGASPGNQAMAARTGMMTMGRQGAGLAGQQALAGLQERQMAQQANAQLYSQMGNQNLQAALGGQQNALQGYGAIEQARGGRFNALTGVMTNQEQGLGMAKDVGQAVAMSDRRLKKGIKRADSDAQEFLKGLRAYRFKYTDEKHGSGEQLGIMAQDLERTHLGKQAVIDTPAGKAVHGAKLATALAAAASSMDRRLRKLEKGSK